MTDPAPRPATAPRRHAGPPLAPVATVYALLFVAGLFPVTAFGGQPFPAPWEGPETIAAFFNTRGDAVRLSAALQFGAAIPLGIFTATVVSRLQFLGVRAAGAWIALVGGVTASVTMIAASSVLWAMAQPAVADEPGLIQGFYWLEQALGGSGFSAPFGLLVAGVSVTAAFARLLPTWVVVFGLAIAVCAELSWLGLLIPQSLLLVPLTRFAGFIWLIAVGMWLPTSIKRESHAAASA